MKTEMVIRIESKKINAELTQEEAKLLYDQLSEFFGPMQGIKWEPFANPMGGIPFNSTGNPPPIKYLSESQHLPSTVMCLCK